MKALSSCVVASIVAGLAFSAGAAAAQPAVQPPLTSARVLEDLQLAVAFDVRRSSRTCGSDRPCVEVTITNQAREPVTIRHAVKVEHNVNVLLYARNGRLVAQLPAASVPIHGGPAPEETESTVVAGDTLTWVLPLEGSAASELIAGSHYTCFVSLARGVQASRASWSGYRRVAAVLRQQKVPTGD